MLRTPLASERIQRIDLTTGVKVIQITSYPSPSEHLHYNWPSVTPDNGRVIIRCQRAAARGAPVDLFRCDTDGLNLFQLTEREPDAGTPSVRMTLCRTGAPGDGKAGHAHPLLSHDGRVCVFRSDRTGVSQVYVAHVNDEFRESVIAGELYNPADKWM